ncbi:hypothetical protein HOLleu_17159 [Holothuria leucospilota]|uniref:Uncharacterized protein n=1 Tax=Holothuria leucospilota TaxID=206669 RepID=A0A9Q1C777_HOLLE|nr:hypothetical protein HOLleu_17159 [Holothuria leucospilota]
MPRRRPRGSLGPRNQWDSVGRGRGAQRGNLGLGLSSSLTQLELADSGDECTSIDTLSDQLESSIQLMYTELQKICKEFVKAIERNTRDIKTLQAENNTLKENCQSLETQTIIYCFFSKGPCDTSQQSGKIPS